MVAKTDDEPETEEGTLLVLKGPPGCGKTTSGFLMCLRLAYAANIPVMAIDPARELTGYIKDFYDAHDGDTEEDRDVREWLSDEDCVRILIVSDDDDEIRADPRHVFSYDGALDKVRSAIRANIVNAKVTREPQMLIFLDELASIRQHREKFQNTTIPLGRNAGTYFAGTLHTEAGLTPKGWTCVRGVCQWQDHTEGTHVQVCNQRIPNDLLAPHKSDIVTLVRPSVSGVMRFNLNDPLPKVIATPVWPSQKYRRRIV